MSRPKPIVRKLCELQSGQLADFFAVLSERTKSTTRDGKPCYACKFRDARRTASCMIWGDSERYPECERDWQPGMFFKVRATFEYHRQFGPRLDLHNIRFVNEQDRADGFAEANLLEQSRFDRTAMFDELRGLADEALADEPLRKLALLLLDAHAEKLKTLPGSSRHYHPYPGGWLEHTLAVTKNCLWLVDHYRELYDNLTPPLNRDLVVAGAILHEIGRAVELEISSVPNEPAEKTIAGHLLGHVLLSRDLVRDTARQVPECNPELLLLLDHLIMTHLAVPEWGSPRLPLIPEALILHHADDLDAKMEMFTRCLRKDGSAGPLTDRDPTLGRQLLKDRKV
jgi:3'-5' exoribonuclease